MTVDVRWATLTAAHAGLLPLLSPLERGRVESLSRPADRARSMLAAALLRRTVAEYLECDPAEVVVDRTCAECGRPHGAPRIITGGPPGSAPHVSVSHSGLLVLVALDPRGPVGVDVQRIADLADPADADPWVRREALAKAQPADPGGTEGADGGRAREATATATADGTVRPVAVRHIDAPLAGYAAALAGAPERIAAPRIGRWAGAPAP